MHSCAHVHFGVFGATFVRLLGDACVAVVSTARSLVSWGEGENGVSSPGPLMNLFMIAPATRDLKRVLEASTRILGVRGIPPLEFASISLDFALTLVPRV